MSKSLVNKVDVKLIVEKLKADGIQPTRAEVNRKIKEKFSGHSLSPNTLKVFMDEISEESSIGLERLPERTVSGIETLIKELFSSERAKLSVAAAEQVAIARADRDAVDAKNYELQEMIENKTIQLKTQKDEYEERIGKLLDNLSELTTLSARAEGKVELLEERLKNEEARVKVLTDSLTETQISLRERERELKFSQDTLAKFYATKISNEELDSAKKTEK